MPQPTSFRDRTSRPQSPTTRVVTEAGPISKRAYAIERQAEVVEQGRLDDVAVAHQRRPPCSGCARADVPMAPTTRRLRPPACVSPPGGRVTDAGRVPAPPSADRARARRSSQPDQAPKSISSISGDRLDVQAEPRGDGLPPSRASARAGSIGLPRRSSAQSLREASRLQRGQHDRGARRRLRPQSTVPSSVVRARAGRGRTSWSPGDRAPESRLAIDETERALARLGVGELLRRRLHEVARRADERARRCPRSSASLAQRTASMTTPAEFGESQTSSFSSTLSGTPPNVVPSIRI